MEISASLIWLSLPHLAIIFLDEASLKSIRDKSRSYIGWVEPKGNIFTCARIYVGMDLERCLLKVIQINMEGWSHIQSIEYEKIPFKCNYFHEYGCFAKRCPKT
jgi:hypothetical protein